MILPRSFHLALIVIFLTAFNVAGQRSRFDDRVSKEGILENRRVRKVQLESMILDARKKLADHSAGEIKLTAKEKEDLERRISLFQKKVDDLGKELDDRDWDMLLRREHRHAERRRKHFEREL